MTPAQFRDWLESQGLSQNKASKELGVSRNTIRYYLTGQWRIPRLFELACRGLEKGEPQ